jgi:hypothetical protein
MVLSKTLFCFTMMGISVVAAYFLFSKNRRESLISGGPLFIVGFFIFFYIGFAQLPVWLPDLFERLLGHSIWADSPTSAGDNVIRLGGAWLMRWLHTVRAGYLWIVLAGIAWALVNIMRRRAWKLNALCAVVGVLIEAAHVYLFKSCFPVCL